METKSEFGLVALVGARAFLVAALSLPVGGQVTSRVSVGSGGTEGNHYSGTFGISISRDGRYVAFQSNASNLVSGDTNTVYDVFVHDRFSGATQRVSVGSGGAQGNENSWYPSISADGRYVAFMSVANNLASGDTNAFVDVFVRDRQSGTTERVSVDSGEAQGNEHSYSPSISADGRYVAFHSDANNLVSGDTNDDTDVFLRDRQAGTTEHVSVDSNEVKGNSGSRFPSISPDGRYVAFHSSAENLVSGDTNGLFDIYLRDRQNGTTVHVSVNSGGVQGNGDSLYPSLSADGRYVAFESSASNLVSGDTNGDEDVFVRDRNSGGTERVSVDSGGVQGNDGSEFASISADGRYVAFHSQASNLVGGDTNFTQDVFIRDRQSGGTEHVSVATGGTGGNSHSRDASTSADGRYVAFYSFANNLVSGDTNDAGDVFVRDRNPTGFTSLCDPGVGSVRVCPCANPPVGAGRGCNNSSATDGAILSASGMAYLSMDGLVFMTSGERPTALSVLLQGNALLPNGVIYGQGVRCAGGSLKRLFVKTAVGGSITAPNFGAGDLPVSVRSASLGDSIQAGQSRWYLVFYRDPIVLGGCPATSTFNSTQTGKVSWAP